MSPEWRPAMVRAALTLLTLGSGPCKRAGAQDVPLVVEHVTVIDVIAGRAQPDHLLDVLLRLEAGAS